MSAWKDHERRVAKKLGGFRNGPNPGSDVGGTPYSVECKRTTRYCLRRDWITQARRQAKLDKRPWLLVISEHNDRAPLVVMEFNTFVSEVMKEEPPPYIHPDQTELAA